MRHADSYMQDGVGCGLTSFTSFVNKASGSCWQSQGLLSTSQHSSHTPRMNNNGAKIPFPVCLRDL